MIIQFTQVTFHQWTILWFKFGLLRLKMKTFNHHIKSKFLKLHFFTYFKRRGIHATILSGNEFSFLHSLPTFSEGKAIFGKITGLNVLNYLCNCRTTQKFNLVCIETLLEVYSNLVPSLARNYKPFLTRFFL